MVIYFNYQQVPKDLPPNTLLWPELNGTTPRTEEEIMMLVRYLPNDTVLLTNSSIVLFTMRMVRVSHPESITLELCLQDGGQVKFDSHGDPLDWEGNMDWTWYRNIQSVCVEEIINSLTKRRLDSRR